MAHLKSRSSTKCKIKVIWKYFPPTQRFFPRLAIETCAAPKVKEHEITGTALKLNEGQKQKIAELQSSTKDRKSENKKRSKKHALIITVGPMEEKQNWKTKKNWWKPSDCKSASCIASFLRGSSPNFSLLWSLCLHHSKRFSSGNSYRSSLRTKKGQTACL